jgi:hypothetical protein
VDLQQAKSYRPNDPTPYTRNSAGGGSPAGQGYQSTAFADTIAATFSNPTTLVLLGVAAVLVVVLIAKRR